MRKHRGYFVMLLAVMLFAGISIQAFAAQAGDMKSVQGCVHNIAPCSQTNRKYQW